MATLQAINWFDVVLAVIIMASAMAGLRTGFARVVVGLIALVTGLLAGFWCYRMIAVKLQPWVSSAGTANVTAFLIIFVGVLLAGALLAAVLSAVFKWVGLSWFNHLLGGFAGFVRGILLIAVLANVLIAFAPSPTPLYLQKSRVLPYADYLAAILAELAPQHLKDSFHQQMENLRRYRSVTTASSREI